MTDINAGSTPSNRQIMLSLAYLTYCGDRITTPDPDAEIGALILAGMEQIPVLCTTTVPDWKQVWGPVSYTTPGSLYQDNLMYLVQNRQNPSAYAVAIRGTNHVSDLDWLMDDFDVLQQMPWPPGNTDQNATAQISESTSIALQVLLSMKSGGQTLLQYLKTVTRAPITLCVTGHSLGGCLASAFGLHLTENVRAWDASGTSQVSCVTFAAPTAGNAAFAQLVENAFSTTTATFDRVQCSLDIVPLAWVSSNIVNTQVENPSGYNLSAIFDIYYQDGSQQSADFVQMEWPEDEVWGDEVLDSVLPSLQADVFNSLGYTQPFSGAEPLPGTFYSDDPSYYAYDQDFETTAKAFAKQAGYQHSSSYPNLLNVPQLLESTVINQTGSGSGSVSTAPRPKSRFLLSLAVAAFKGLKDARLKPVRSGTEGQGSPSQ